MRRREFITLVGGAAAIPWPFAVCAQQGPLIRRLAVLLPLAENDPEGLVRIAALKAQLQQLGWTDGRNLHLEVRFAGSMPEQIRIHASQLAAQRPDVILVNSNPGIAAVVREAPAIPTVFVQVADPVGGGFIASMARPGGNVTGFSNFEPPMGGKWLETIKEIAPTITRAAILLHPETAAHTAFLDAANAASKPMRVAVSPLAVHDAAEIERAVADFAREPNGGVITLPHIVTVEHRDLIAQLALRYRLPSVGAFKFTVTSGGLVSYGIDVVDLYRRAAVYVDRILKGAKPADLPVQAPTKYELVINLKTAKALGLTVPPTLLARADEVIE